MNWEYHLWRMSAVLLLASFGFLFWNHTIHWRKPAPVPKPGQWILANPDPWKPNPEVQETDATNAMTSPVQPDWSKVNPENKGYSGDINGDGVPDFLIFQNDTLFWKQSGLGELKPLLKIKNGPVIAYTIGAMEDKGRPVFMYFTADKKGYYLGNIGTNSEGAPVFGEAESR